MGLVDEKTKQRQRLQHVEDFGVVEAVVPLAHGEITPAIDALVHLERRPEDLVEARSARFGTIRPFRAVAVAPRRLVRDVEREFAARGGVQTTATEGHVLAEGAAVLGMAQQSRDDLFCRASLAKAKLLLHAQRVLLVRHVIQADVHHPAALLAIQADLDVTHLGQLVGRLGRRRRRPAGPLRFDDGVGVRAQGGGVLGEQRGAMAQFPNREEGFAFDGRDAMSRKQAPSV